MIQVIKTIDEKNETTRKKNEKLVQIDFSQRFFDGNTLTLLILIKN